MCVRLVKPDYLAFHFWLFFFRTLFWTDQNKLWCSYEFSGFYGKYFIKLCEGNAFENHLISLGKMSFKKIPAFWKALWAVQTEVALISFKVIASMFRFRDTLLNSVLLLKGPYPPNFFKKIMAFWCFLVL